MSSGTTNAWGARESWMVSSPLKEDSDWGPREYRGPIWEIITGLTLSLAGNDLFMMMHPAAVLTVRDVIRRLGTVGQGTMTKASDWVNVRI